MRNPPNPRTDAPVTVPLAALARELRLSQAVTRRKAFDGGIPARPVGGAWFVTQDVADTLRAWAATRVPRSRWPLFEPQEPTP